MMLFQFFPIFLLRIYIVYKINHVIASFWCEQLMLFFYTEPANALHY